MGVDSGLCCYRGAKSGVWPPLVELGLDYEDMANPRWFDRDPRLAWAYWQWSHNLYTTTAPHAVS